MIAFQNISLGTTLILFGPVPLLAFAVVPRAWANRHVHRIVALSAGATTVSLGVAAISAVNVAFAGRTEQIIAAWGVFRVGIYFDQLSALLFLLVAFLGAVVTRYAFTYLKGDPEQGHFLKWLCITIGAVLTLLVSGNLLLFTVAWMTTSLSLNKLLTFYADRPAAITAARKKFVISRLGDVCLLIALVLVYQCFGTWEFGEMFARSEALRSGGMAMPDRITSISLLLVAGAMLKSAQFPFHSWLPDTMETPTPVSALMHAGIINAGGFLVIRLSPVISLSPLALQMLVVVGAFTAIFASLVMTTQASVKRMLAFSTIAQMGFMMLQCGLGAFSIAVLHIVAHSLYKAHAFLSSGSVVEISKASWVPTGVPAAHLRALALSLLAAAVLTFAGAAAFGVSPQAEPGVIILGAVFLMSLAHLLWSLWGQAITPRLVGAGTVLAGTVCVAYFALHLGFKTLLAPVLPHHGLSPSPAVAATPGTYILMAVVVTLFAAVLVLQSQLPMWAERPWCRTLYVHARNGFYFNTLANRAVHALWPAR